MLGLLAHLSNSASGALCPPRYAPGVTLRDKVHSCEFRRALNVDPLLLIENTQLRLFDHVSRMLTGRLARQDLLAKPTGKRPRCRSRPRRSNRISNLGWSRLVVEPAELSEIAVDRAVFQVLLWMLPPQPSLEEKRTWKWMKWITFTLFYSPVCKCAQLASEQASKM